MVSILRVLKNIRQGGIKQWWRNMQYIGDAKHGRLVGTDSLGNKYFENYNPYEEVPGRQRWVDYSQDDFNASQAVPEWHAWLHHIRTEAPTDEAMKKYTPNWKAPYCENITGTRGRSITYSTTAPKIRAWEPVVKKREGNVSA